MKNEVVIFCPGTVANVCCGFDALGFALGGPGDVIKASLSEGSGVVIKEIHGAELSKNIEENAAGKAAQSLLDRWGLRLGVELTLWKGISPGSGIGSSSASASGAAAAVAFLLERSIHEKEVFEAALDGEELASGSRHADNVAPALFGGWILSAGNELTTVSLKSSLALEAIVLHPEVTINTTDSRNVLPRQVDLSAAVKQAANLALLTTGLQQDRLDLLSQSLVDLIAEPSRKHLIYNFDLIKETALNSGAIGGGISGSGPSTFWLCSPERSDELAQDLKALVKNFEITYHIYQGPISPVGARIIQENEILQYLR